MVERPILMSAAMVDAMMRSVDTKEQTRRSIKPQPYIDAHGNFCWKGSNYGQNPSRQPNIQAIASPYPSARTGKVLCPFGKPGDRLWVRESYWADKATGQFSWYVSPVITVDRERDHVKLRPSIHMPRSICRLVLEIMDIRVERLQDISEADAIAEGIDGPMCAALSTKTPWTNVVAPAAVHAFAALWEQTYGPGAWAANPWVWAVTFRRVR